MQISVGTDVHQPDRWSMGDGNTMVSNQPSWSGGGRRNQQMIVHSVHNSQYHTSLNEILRLRQVSMSDFKSSSVAPVGARLSWHGLPPRSRRGCQEPMKVTRILPIFECKSFRKEFNHQSTNAIAPRGRPSHLPFSP